MPYATREQWLTAGAKAMSKWFTRVEGANEVPKIRVSCAWAKRARTNTIGWHWHSECSEDGTDELQISPEKADPTRALDILRHEMVDPATTGVAAPWVLPARGDVPGPRRQDDRHGGRC